eukprot:8113671-Alexandrium_andersonii.AAC.1
MCIRDRFPSCIRMMTRDDYSGNNRADRFLYSVLPKWIPCRWTCQVHEAQAVCTRVSSLVTDDVS